MKVSYQHVHVFIESVSDDSGCSSFNYCSYRRSCTVFSKREICSALKCCSGSTCLFNAGAITFCHLAIYFNGEIPVYSPRIFTAWCYRLCPGQRGYNLRCNDSTRISEEIFPTSFRKVGPISYNYGCNIYVMCEKANKVGVRMSFFHANSKSYVNYNTGLAGGIDSLK